jgi:hypothetical protein
MKKLTYEATIKFVESFRCVTAAKTMSRARRWRSMHCSGTGISLSYSLSGTHLCLNSTRARVPRTLQDNTWTIVSYIRTRTRLHMTHAAETSHVPLTLP